MIRTIAAGFCLAGLLSSSCLGASAANDIASNFTYDDGWTSGDNGGTGFSNWTLSNNASTTLFAGFFIGDSTAGSGNINTSGESFGMFANPANAFASATRSFNGGALSQGQTFTLQLAVNFRNGSKGFNLNGSGGQRFNFNIGGDAYTYKVNGGAGQALFPTFQPDSVITLSFTQQAGTNVDLSITRTSSAGGVENFSQTFNFGGGLESFEFYISDTENGGSANNLYFNNLSVTAIPEPSALLLFAAPCLLGAWIFGRRKRVFAGQ